MSPKKDKSVEYPTLTKSELIDRINQHSPHLFYQDVELAVNSILDCMMESLIKGGRIEIRGFGSISLHYRRARTGRNPKTGEDVSVQEKYVPHFKPGSILRFRVDKHNQSD